MAVARALGGAVRGAWTSADGTADYDAALGTIRAPIYALASRGDRFFSPPRALRAFLAPVAGPLHVEELSADDRGGPAPSHLGIVTSPACRAPHLRGLAWLLAQIEGRGAP